MTLRVINPRVVEPDMSGAGLTGRKVLAAFVAFFGVVFAVNGYFLYAALSTHTGIVAVEPYRKGLAYNERIAAADRQAELSWSETLDVAIDGRVEVALRDRDGTSLRGLVLEGSIGRPSTDRQDHVLRFVERDGLYVADAGSLLEGAWIVSFSARRLDTAEPVFRSRRRLWLKQ